MLEDYRASLTLDRRHEEADRAADARRCHLLILWSQRDDLEDLHGDPVRIWGRWVGGLRGHGIDSGHHMAEEDGPRHASPWHQWDEAPGWDDIPWDREGRPSPDEVLAVRRERQAMVRHVIESLTDEQLAAEVTRTEPGWPGWRTSPFSNVFASSSTRKGSTGSMPSVT